MRKQFPEQEPENSNHESRTNERKDKLAQAYGRITSRVKLMWKQFRQHISDGQDDQAERQKLTLFESLYDFSVIAYKKDLIVYRDIKTNRIEDNFWIDLFVWFTSTMSSFSEPPEFESINEAEMQELVMFLTQEVADKNPKMFADLFSANQTQISDGKFSGNITFFYVPGLGTFPINLN